VIPCRYDAVTDFSGGKAYAKLGGSWQIINRAGAVLDHTDIGLLRLRKN